MKNILTSGKFQYRCNVCKKIIKRDTSRLYWELQESRERNHEMENIYIASVQDLCWCGKELLIEFSISEYPVGILNAQNKQTSGCSVLGKLDVSL